VIRTYFLATDDDPHKYPDSDIITLLAEWLDRRGKEGWALAMHCAAVAQAIYAARQEET